MEDYIQKKNLTTATNNERPFYSDVRSLVQDLLGGFAPISLEEMDKVKLMKRIDTKYLLNSKQLPCLLQKAQANYRIVEIDGRRISPYSSVYLDTDRADMYLMHHNRRMNRYKVRMRSYLDSGISFLEVKTKNNKGFTSKKRMMVDNLHFEKMEIDDNEKQFIVEKTPCSSNLHPTLQNFFQRITLVDIGETERVTIDLNLTYKNPASSEALEMGDLVVVEIKQDGDRHSHFRDFLSEISILPQNMSKYCIGMALTYPELKSNRFKNKIRKINKITHNL